MDLNNDDREYLEQALICIRLFLDNPDGINLQKQQIVRAILENRENNSPPTEFFD